MQCSIDPLERGWFNREQAEQPIDRLTGWLAGPAESRSAKGEWPQLLENLPPPWRYDGEHLVA